MLIFNLQNVEKDSCFMSRLLILTMDESTQLHCDEKHYIKHCIPYVREMEGGDFRQNGFYSLVWLRTKMTLALMHANLTVFTLDSDVLLFRVPDVDAIISTNRDAHFYYQAENLDYPALYANTSAGEDDPNIEDYPDLWYGGLNSGQVLWRPTEMLKLAIPSALRLAGEAGDQLDQEVIARAISEVGGWGKTQPLSQLYAFVRGYDSVAEHSAYWVSYHANGVTGQRKMSDLRTVQNSWKALQQKVKRQTGRSW
jgi:hypothetical protein